MARAPVYSLPEKNLLGGPAATFSSQRLRAGSWEPSTSRPSPRTSDASTLNFKDQRHTLSNANSESTPGKGKLSPKSGLRQESRELLTAALGEVPPGWFGGDGTTATHRGWQRGTVTGGRRRLSLFPCKDPTAARPQSCSVHAA